MHIRKLSIKELEEGLHRCKARRDGLLPYRFISPEDNLKALETYKNELARRRHPDSKGLTIYDLLFGR